MSPTWPCSECRKPVEVSMNPGLKMWDGLCDECRNNKFIVKENKVVGTQSKKLEATSIYRPTLQGRNLSVEEQKEKDTKERAEIARTGLLFDLNNFANYWQHGDKRYYFEKIRKASSEELLRFRKVIHGQKSLLKKRQAFSNSQLSLYDLLVAAINFELLKRRPFLFSVYKFFLPFRKKLAWWLGHREAHYHDEFGVIFVYKESYNFFYAPVSKYLRALGRFWLLHWKFLITTCLTILGLWMGKDLILNIIKGDYVAGNKTVIGEQLLNVGDNPSSRADNKANIDIAKIKIDRVFDNFNQDFRNETESFSQQSERIAADFSSRNIEYSGIFIQAQEDLSIKTKRELDSILEKLKRGVEDVLIGTLGKPSLEAAGPEFNQYVGRINEAEGKVKNYYLVLNDNPKSWEMKTFNQIQLTSHFDVTKY